MALNGLIWKTCYSGSPVPTKMKTCFVHTQSTCRVYFPTVHCKKVKTLQNSLFLHDLYHTHHNPQLSYMHANVSTFTSHHHVLPVRCLQTVITLPIPHWIRDHSTDMFHYWEQHGQQTGWQWILSLESNFPTLFRSSSATVLKWERQIRILSFI